MKSKNVKSTPTKGKSNKRADSTTKVAMNIGILPSGVYRARKMIDGIAYSATFSNKKNAKRWLNSL